jgi:glycosyltransferase involved in cell wall biosynthesis
MCASVTPYSPMEELCDQYLPFRACGWGDVIGALRQVADGLPLQIPYFCPVATRDLIRQAFRDGRFDLVQIQLARMGPVLDLLGNVPTVIDFVDALSANLHRRAEWESWPKRIVFKSEGERMARYEQHLIEKTRFQMVNSPADKKALGDHPTIHIVPNGVEISEFSFRTTRRANYDIIFSGNMDYFPNVDAARFFARDVFPRVRAQLPNAHFLIAGANPAATVVGLGKIPGVVVTGAVTDLRPLIQDACLAVSPTRAGSGMQLKVLEAMALGTPVVATPQALGGSLEDPKRCLLVAETAEEFARQVIRLLQDAPLQERLARHARQIVESRFCWDESAKRLEEVYERTR